MSEETQVQLDETLVNGAFGVFTESEIEPGERKAVETMMQRIPDYSEEQYRAAWAIVRNLFDCACHLVFRWSNENSVGTTFDLPDTRGVFLQQLNATCGGFTQEQYDKALEYAFEKTIF
ncbi:MAG: hypothetical protein IPG59_12250 [Candidatus Melainabacteria bacterium]|nr:MAG: hypothetical protein IPG59_12250 [Candidatus Melainabacteria bacterium]